MPLEKQKLTQDSAKLQNALKLYDLAEKLLEMQEKRGISDSEREQFKSAIRDLHQILRKDTHLAIEVEKIRGADLTTEKEYTGKTLKALIYWANSDEMGAEVDKFISESADIAKLLSKKVLVGKQKEPMEMKRKREDETEKAIERLQRQQIKENAKFGVGLSEKGTDGKLTFRSFFRAGEIIHNEIEYDLRERTDGGDRIAKSALDRLKRWTEVASLNKRYYIGKLDAAFAALSSAEVRNQMYPDMEVIFSTPKNEIGQIPYQQAVDRSAKAIKTRMNEIVKQMGDKQKLWEDRKEALRTNIDRGGIISLELIDRSKKEIEEFFSDRVKNKTQLAETLTYLVFAEHALEMLESKQG